MSIDEYRKALKMGQKNFRANVSKGRYPYLQVLDDILEHTETESVVPLGLVDIPMELIVGTKTAGRTSAFASNFMPLLAEKTEFAQKWSVLCDAQENEGIRDPIVAFEFMNRFYVQEGNKRVSVLKFFGAARVPGTVTRIIPKRTDTKENRIYYEFLDFYTLTQINFLWFTEEGRFAALVAAVGKAPGERWTQEEKLKLASVYLRFREAYNARGGDRLSITAGDALLAFLKVHPYSETQDMSVAQLHDELGKMWDEIVVLTRPSAVELSMEPKPYRDDLTSIAKRFLQHNAPKLKVGFVHEKDAVTSPWTYGHEFGRGELEETLGSRVQTFCIDNVIAEENGEDAIRQLIEEKECEVVFTTTPKLMPAALKMAIEHPEVKILNCSLNMTHPSVRTYYGRIHEVKFLIGAIAGALAEDDKIGYVATYPTYGMTAAINAFALGARMVNPRAKVHLLWTAQKNTDIDKYFYEHGVSVISTHDIRDPRGESDKFGLYRIKDGDSHHYAMPFWNWGEYYVRIVRSILDGAWKQDGEAAGNGAINYWWGMSTGVVDVIVSRSLPLGTKRLVDLLRETICRRDFDPFRGVLYAQGGVCVQPEEHEALTPEQIITMDWLAENVIGEIPPFDTLIDAAKPLVTIQGVGKAEKPSKIL